MNKSAKLYLLVISLFTMPTAYSALLTLSPQSEVSAMTGGSDKQLDSTPSFNDIAISPVMSPVNSLSNVSEEAVKQESVSLVNDTAQVQVIASAEPAQSLTRQGSFAEISSKLLVNEYALNKESQQSAL